MLRHFSWHVPVLLLGGSVTMAQEPLKSVAAFEPPHALLGTPLSLRVVVANESDKPVQVPTESHFVFALHWRLEAAGGLRQPTAGPRPGSLNGETLAPGATRSYLVPATAHSVGLPQPCRAGHFSPVLSLDLSSLDPPGPANAARPVAVELEVAEPTGEDAAAYSHLLEQLRGFQALDLDICGAAHVATFIQGSAGDLLRAYPTSTYAAYVVRRCGIDGMGGKVHRILNILEYCRMHGLEGLEDIGVPCEQACSNAAGLKTLHRAEVVLWREKWFSAVLASHPNLWFADELRLAGC